MCRAATQIEIVILRTSNQNSGLSALRSLKTLRVLKSFRVLRVLKMFRYLESLRKIGEVLVNSMSSFFSIALLIVLFTIVFSIMGLHVYGHYDPDIGSPNFHTFFDSVVLIFQVGGGRDRHLHAAASPRRRGEGRTGAAGAGAGGKGRRGERGCGGEDRSGGNAGDGQCRT